MNMVKIDVKFSEEDIYLFQKRVLYKKVPPVVCMIISFLLGTIGIFLLVDSLSKGEDTFGSIGLIILPVIFIIVSPYALKKAAKNAINTNKLLQKTHTYELNNEGLKTTTEIGRPKNNN